MSPYLIQPFSAQPLSLLKSVQSETLIAKLVPRTACLNASWIKVNSTFLSLFWPTPMQGICFVYEVCNVCWVGLACHTWLFTLDMCVCVCVCVTWPESPPHTELHCVSSFPFMNPSYITKVRFISLKVNRK